jgi:hypothetical protein
MSRKETISFFSTVSAGGEKTLVSQRINTPFTTSQIAISFPDGHNRLVQIKIFVSKDPTAPTTGEPQGLNILASLGHVFYLVGNNERKVFDIQKPYAERGAYIKVYAKNNDGFLHQIDCQITIELEEYA